MGNKTRMAEIVEKMQRVAQKKADPWENILPNISKGCAIPVISSSFRMEQIFHELMEEDESTVVEELIAEWVQADRLAHAGPLQPDPGRPVLFCGTK